MWSDRSASRARRWSDRAAHRHAQLALKIPGDDRSFCFLCDGIILGWPCGSDVQQGAVLYSGRRRLASSVWRTIASLRARRQGKLTANRVFEMAMLRLAAFSKRLF